MVREFEEYPSGGDASGHNRPRRPNADTITYLRGLPLDAASSRSEVKTYLDQEAGAAEEFPQSFAAALSAIDEVRMEIASLAGDEHGSQCLETLAHVALPYSETAARVLLSACSGYHLHLATHRFGSHVVQTILQLAVSSASKDDLALDEEAPQFQDSPEGLPSLAELITGMVEELAPSASQLVIHVCGSHVLRTLLCVLGGVELVSSHGPGNENRADGGAILRGKKKSKKKKKKAPDSDALGARNAGSVYVTHRKNSRIEAKQFTSTLENLALSILGTPTNEPGELQQLSCHSSAGPLLIILLRVLTYSSQTSNTSLEEPTGNEAIADFRLGIARSEPTFVNDSVAHTMAKRLLCWQDGEDEQKHIGDVVYGLSGELRGSHLLETLLQVSSDEVHGTILKYGDFENPVSLQGYVEHDVANFVVQTLLTTVRTKEQAESMLKVVEKVISSGLAVDPSRKRRGVLWRAAELASKFRIEQDSLLKAVRLGFGALNPSEPNDEATDEKKKKKRRKASALEICNVVPLLVNTKKPDQEQDRISLDAAGARSVYHMLRFTPRLCEEVLKGLLEGLSAEELELIAQDGLGSRCLMDGILDGPTKTPIFGSATKTLYSKLQGRWVALSTHRVGHHTVKKLYSALPRIDDKAKLLTELEAAGNRLAGNAMGRSVMETCRVEEFRENSKEWRKTVSKMLAKESKGPDDFTAVKVATVDGSEPAPAPSKRKRKRKRPEKKSGDSEAAQPDKKLAVSS